MKKIQILTGLIVLSGAGLLTACGDISIGDATGAGADIGYNCSNSQLGGATIKAYNEISAKIRYCVAKVPAVNDSNVQRKLQGTCEAATSCSPAR